MKISIRKGVSFGLTSSMITTLGLIIGLNAGTHLKGVVIAGILTIAIADAFSDALGIHISEESGRKKSSRLVWESTIATFFSKFFFALTFLVPVLLFELDTAIIVSIIWGLLLIGILSFYTARIQKTSATKAIFEHILITILVIILTNYVGNWISGLF